MKSKLLLISTVFLLSACKSTPNEFKASQSDINEYFENQVLKPQNGNVEHSEYGRMAATMKPYTTDFNECQTEAFSGKSFMFAELEISDPKKLNQYSDDYLMHLVSFIIPKNGRRNVTIKPIFDDKSFKSTLDGIHVLTKKTLDCVKNKGWIYLTNKNSKK